MYTSGTRYTCKPRRPAALHSYTWLPATQTWPVSQQRGSRSGSMKNHVDHRDEELIGTPFFMTIWNVVLWRVLYFRHSSVGAEGFGDELWQNSCSHMTLFYFRHGWALPGGMSTGGYDEPGIFVIDAICSMTKFKMSYGKTSWMLLFLLVRGTIPNNSFSWENAYICRADFQSIFCKMLAYTPSTFQYLWAVLQ